MKRILFVLVLCLVAMSSVRAIDDDYAYIKYLIDETEKELLGSEMDGMQFKGTVIEGKNIYFKMIVDESDFEGMTLKQALDLAGMDEADLEKEIREGLMSTDYSEEELRTMERIIDSGYKFYLRFIGNPSFDVMNCQLNFSDALKKNNHSREYIRNRITDWGECRNVAITENQGDVAFHGKSGWASRGLPDDLETTISKLNKEGQYIRDVHITESGSWIVLYGRNGCSWSGIPKALEKAIRDYNHDDEEIRSATFNDDGDWIVITDQHYTASNTKIMDWLKDGANSYGTLFTACLTDDAGVACYEGGYKFLGTIPTGLKQRLQETDIDVYHIKICGESYFFADKEGNYRYKM